MRASNGSVDDGRALQASKEISKSVESLGFPHKLHLQTSSISIYNSKILLVSFETSQWSLRSWGSVERGWVMLVDVDVAAVHDAIMVRFLFRGSVRQS